MAVSGTAALVYWIVTIFLVFTKISPYFTGKSSHGKAKVKRRVQPFCNWGREGGNERERHFFKHSRSFDLLEII